eukprot:3043195-Rhodomonas_salina.1
MGSRSRSRSRSLARSLSLSTCGDSDGAAGGDGDGGLRALRLRPLQGHDPGQNAPHHLHRRPLHYHRR